jgi:hypothetical protein
VTTGSANVSLGSDCLTVSSVPYPATRRRPPSRRSVGRPLAPSPGERATAPQ